MEHGEYMKPLLKCAVFFEKTKLITERENNYIIHTVINDIETMNELKKIKNTFNKLSNIIKDRAQKIQNNKKKIEPGLLIKIEEKLFIFDENIRRLSLQPEN